MAGRKTFLLRIDETTFEALRRWADDDLRSLNSQIEYLLRKALKDHGRLSRSGDAGPAAGTGPISKGH